MGGRSTRPASAPIPARKHQPLPCDDVTQKENQRKLLRLFNDNFRDLAQQPLPAHHGCSLGSLARIQLCDLVQISVPGTKGTCPFSITVNRLEGLEALQILELKVVPQPPAILSFVMRLRVPWLRGTITTKVLDMNCAAYRRLLSNALHRGVLQCSESPITIGDTANPLYLTVAVSVLASCSAATIRENVAVKAVVQLHHLSIQCKGALSLFPDVVLQEVEKRISAKLSELLQAQLKLRVETALVSAAAALPWCMLARV